MWSRAQAIYEGNPAASAAAFALISLLAIVAAAALSEGASSALELGPLSRHMVLHILMMNAAAPIIAGALVIACRSSDWSPGLGFATLLQIALLWVWHAPPLIVAAHASMPLMLLMHVSLLVAATAFWAAVYSTLGAERWRSIFAVLVTGKLFCLLAAILTFAPRPLYPFDGAGHALHAASQTDMLADQQLAGLLMVIACPLTYVLAGVIIAARWLADVERAPPESLGSQCVPARIP